MKMLSIIVPCFNEEKMIDIFYSELIKSIKELKSELIFEIIFIDDGSTDETLNIIKKLQIKDKQIHYITFSRNFGKESAIYAGLKMAQGDFVIIMDADLQDPPHLIGKMYNNLFAANIDGIFARRITRKGESKIRSWFSINFYKIINKISNLNLKSGSRDYCLITKQMVQAFLALEEYNRFSKGLFKWLGFKTEYIEYENVKRRAGYTKWSFSQLIIYALEAVTSFSDIPLLISSYIGIILCLISAIIITVVVLKTLIMGEAVPGYPSLICIITFLNGIQLLCIGILGKYVSKVYLESKKRPLYIIKDKV